MMMAANFAAVAATMGMGTGIEAFEEGASSFPGWCPVRGSLSVVVPHHQRRALLRDDKKSARRDRENVLRLSPCIHSVAGPTLLVPLAAAEHVGTNAMSTAATCARAEVPPSSVSAKCHVVPVH